MLKNRIVKNASWSIGAQILKSILGLVISMIAARYLGPSNYGLINYAAALTSFASPIMYLGFNGILVMELVSTPEEDGTILGTAVALSFISSIVCIFGLFCFVSIANQGETETIIVCVLYSIILILQSVDLIQYWFQARLLSKYSSMVSLCAFFVSSMYKIALLATRKSVRWFALTSSLEYFIIAIGLYFAYRKLGGGRFAFSLDRAKQMLLKSRYYIISNMMVAVLSQTDRVMLKLMLGDIATGYYSAAVTCSMMTNFVFAAIIDSFRPVIFEKKKMGENEFERSMCLLYNIIIYVSLAQSVAMTALSKIIIGVLYGAKYAPAVPVLKLVVWYTTFAYVGSIRNIWMLSENLQRYIVPINIFGALANVMLNMLCIPAMGAMGAALASLVTQIFTNVITGFVIKPVRPNNRLMINALKIKYTRDVLFILQGKKV